MTWRDLAQEACTGDSRQQIWKPVATQLTSKHCSSLQACPKAFLQLVAVSLLLKAALTQFESRMCVCCEPDQQDRMT